MAQELTDLQRTELEADLHSLQVELAEALELSRDGAKPVELDQPIGRISRMDAIQQQKMVQANRRNHQVRLRLVRASLASIDDGEYGQCSECEEPVGYRRLKARPESRYCLACQTARERRQ